MQLNSNLNMLKLTQPWFLKKNFNKKAIQEGQTWA